MNLFRVAQDWEGSEGQESKIEVLHGERAVRLASGIFDYVTFPW